jgi:hypothetical protein
MEVLNIKSIIHPVLDPESLLCPLAFWAMTVTAAVITYPLLTTAVAIIYVSTQGRSTTFLKGIKSTYHKTVGLTLLNKLLSKPICDLGNFKLWPGHYFLGYSVSKGLCADAIGHWATINTPSTYEQCKNYFQSI